MVSEDVKTMFPELGNIVFERHKGDDIGAVTNNHLLNIVMNTAMAAHGHVGQDSKVLIGRGIFEFLR